MKFLPKSELITFKITESMLIDMDTTVSEGKFANRSEVIIQAITEFLSSEKNSIRAFPKKTKKPSIFSEHVKKVKSNLRRTKL